MLNIFCLKWLLKCTKLQITGISAHKHWKISKTFEKAFQWWKYYQFKYVNKRLMSTLKIDSQIIVSMVAHGTVNEQHDKHATPV